MFGEAHRGGRSRVMRALLGACLVTLLSGCAANSVTTLLKASTQRDGIVPSGAVVQGELRGRAFEVGSVGFEVRAAADKQGPDIPDAAYLQLFDTQLRKAFAGAGLDNGALPAHRVDVAIEKLKLMPAKFLIGQRSLLRVRMEVAPPAGPILMRGQFESFVAPPTVMIMGGGYVVPVVLPFEGQEYVALSKLFPAVAVVIAATTQGLQQGKTLDEIRIYPKDIEAGTTIGPDLFLEKAPFGMTAMDYKDMRRVILEAKARGEQ
jgi:hypothetical protein